MNPFTVSTTEAQRLCIEFYRKHPSAKDFHLKLPMPYPVYKEFFYNVKAARRCLRVAEFLGFSHVADLYGQFVSHGEAILRMEAVKRFPLIRRLNYGELARNLIDIQPMPEPISALYYAKDI